MIRPVQYGLCLSRLVGGSRLGEADLRSANLGDADLRHADLRGADLRETDFWWSDLKGADLRRADLRGAFKYGRKATPLACALAKVGAPWDCIAWEWSGRDDQDWVKPADYDHWAGVAKLYMLGNTK